MQLLQEIEDTYIDGLVRQAIAASGYKIRRPPLIQLSHFPFSQFLKTFLWDLADQPRSSTSPQFMKLSYGSTFAVRISNLRASEILTLSGAMGQHAIVRLPLWRILQTTVLNTLFRQHGRIWIHLVAVAWIRWLIEDITFLYREFVIWKSRVFSSATSKSMHWYTHQQLVNYIRKTLNQSTDSLLWSRKAIYLYLYL